MSCLTASDYRPVSVEFFSSQLDVFHAARPLADLFLGDIFAQRIVKDAGPFIGIEPLIRPSHFAAKQ
jgi:hypothetical protein